jgi:hypothetical protein
VAPLEIHASLTLLALLALLGLAPAQDVLFPQVIPATLQIVREEGKVVGLMLKQGGRESKAEKVD